ncbi:MAG TPA: hypothetical protein VFF60_00945 [Candidatus Binatus sp.]|nr:hypothetical protein [Candidatus Binatus sp.]
MKQKTDATTHFVASRPQRMSVFMSGMRFDLIVGGTRVVASCIVPRFGQRS